MTKGLKFFLIAFLLSLPFWWGVNILEKNLEDFFVWQKIGQNPQIFTAQINPVKINEPLKPWRNWEVDELKIEAKSAISVLVNSPDQDKILFSKEIDKKLPIASLTKLMTANIVLDNYDLSRKVQISQKAVEQEWGNGELVMGEIFSVKDLLYFLLMESSNDAAIALAEIVGQQTFVDSMNLEAGNLGLENTYFASPSGLDLDNYSTAEDLAILTKSLIPKSLIWKISAKPEFELYSLDKISHYRLLNTNELLTKIPEIVGGKTGYTKGAEGCFLLVLESPKNNGYLINIILGSEDRFGEMENLINWLWYAYKW